SKPTRIANKLVGQGSSSSVDFDPPAFLWWDPLKLAVLPVSIYDYDSNSDQSNQFTGAIGFHATRADGVTEAGRVSHPATNGYAPPVDRSVVIGNRLFTISTTGALASDLGTFASDGFVAFPAPPPQAVSPPASAPGSGG